MCAEEPLGELSEPMERENEGGNEDNQLGEVKKSFPMFLLTQVFYCAVLQEQPEVRGRDETDGVPAAGVSDTHSDQRDADDGGCEQFKSEASVPLSGTPAADTSNTASSPGLTSLTTPLSIPSPSYSVPPSSQSIRVPPTISQPIQPCKEITAAPANGPLPPAVANVSGPLAGVPPSIAYPPHTVIKTSQSSVIHVAHGPVGVIHSHPGQRLAGVNFMHEPLVQPGRTYTGSRMQQQMIHPPQGKQQRSASESKSRGIQPHNGHPMPQTSASQEKRERPRAATHAFAARNNSQGGPHSATPAGLHSRHSEENQSWGQTYEQRFSQTSSPRMAQMDPSHQMTHQPPSGQTHVSQEYSQPHAVPGRPEVNLPPSTTAPGVHGRHTETNQFQTSPSPAHQQVFQQDASPHKAHDESSLLMEQHSSAQTSPPQADLHSRHCHPYQGAQSEQPLVERAQLQQQMVQMPESQQQTQFPPGGSHERTPQNVQDFPQQIENPVHQGRAPPHQCGPGRQSPHIQEWGNTQHYQVQSHPNQSQGMGSQPSLVLPGAPVDWHGQQAISTGGTHTQVSDNVNGNGVDKQVAVSSLETEINRSVTSQHLKFESHVKRYIVLSVVNWIVAIFLEIVGSSMEEGVAGTIFSVSGVPLFIHAGVSTAITIYKFVTGNKRTIKKSLKDLEQGEGAFKDEEKREIVFFASKPNLIQKIIIWTIGILIDFVTQILEGLANVGVDLNLFWFPQPFYNYMTDRLAFRKARINYHQVEFYADPLDYYMNWLETKTWNFFTFTMYSRFCAKRTYNKWRDKHVRFKGVPPAGWNNEFKWFRAKPSFCYKCGASCCSLLCKCLPPIVATSQMKLSIRLHRGML